MSQVSQVIDQIKTALRLESLVIDLERAYLKDNYVLHDELCDEADRLNSLLQKPRPKTWLKSNRPE